jgi:hypothetical protein
MKKISTGCTHCSNGRKKKHIRSLYTETSLKAPTWKRRYENDTIILKSVLLYTFFLSVFTCNWLSAAVEHIHKLIELKKMVMCVGENWLVIASIGYLLP